ncbi:MAG: sugar ABC transporter ATP-binding protein [Pseudomonadota bacterium]
MPPHNGAPGETLLRLSDISMLYPGVVALNKVSLEVRAGECHGVIGKNGAGKTTLMKIISGIIKQSEGRIFIGNQEIKSLSRRKSREHGISIVTQEPQIIPDFTVAENLFYPDYLGKKGGLIDWNKIFERAEQTAAQAQFRINVQAKAGDLSISEQQLLLVFKAFFVDDDQVVILDEVTAALTRKDQEFLFDLIDRQTKRGKAILFISHRLGEIVRVCSRVTVLRDGKKIATEEVKDLDEEKLSRLIVGEEFQTASVREPRPDASRDARPLEVLAVQGLTNAPLFQDVSFSLKKGEILGLAGLRGSGRTELLKTLAGVYRPDEGRIWLKGREVRFSSPAQALEQGVVYLPEDRDAEGLIEILGVGFNLSLSSLRKITKNLLLQKRLEEETSAGLIRLLAIRTAGLEQEVKSLSGGNRQKVVVGRLMSAGPEVYLLDEPTKGVDIGAKKNILEIIRDQLTRHAGVILTSPSLEDLAEVCDRMLVLYEGRIAREFSRDDFNQGLIYQAMQGVEIRREGQAPGLNPTTNQGD